jgi:hypothetical protein
MGGWKRIGDEDEREIRWYLFARGGFQFLYVRFDD